MNIFRLSVFLIILLLAVSLTACTRNLPPPEASPSPEIPSEGQPQSATEIAKLLEDQATQTAIALNPPQETTAPPDESTEEAEAVDAAEEQARSPTLGEPKGEKEQDDTDHDQPSRAERGKCQHRHDGAGQSEEGPFHPVESRNGAFPNATCPNR